MAPPSTHFIRGEIERHRLGRNGIRGHTVGVYSVQTASVGGIAAARLVPDAERLPQGSPTRDTQLELPPQHPP